MTRIYELANNQVGMDDKECRLCKIDVQTKIEYCGQGVCARKLEEENISNDGDED